MGHLVAVSVHAICATVIRVWRLTTDFVEGLLVVSDVDIPVWHNMDMPIATLIASTYPWCLLYKYYMHQENSINMGVRRCQGA